jgi:tRNA-Thr(GGU) m(6)t(6)A37 methyltransferase TsaA
MESNISKAEVFFKDLSLEIKSLFIQFIKKIFTEKFLEIKYFNTENTTEEELNKIIEFIINKNSVKSYKGDLSTNSLIKFYHYILKDKEENIDNKIFEKNKQDFISIFEKNFEDFINKENKNNKIEKYEINNHYINIFLKDKTILEDSENSDKINNIKDNDSFIFNSIGTLISCFPEKFSSPRQGNLLELTRAKIVLKKNIDMHSFDGIENFTYIWIIYVFHLNQNFLSSKVTPPKYPGDENSKKLGIFATRTPHRYNPIGLTLCKFNKIEGREIFISCVDMITGTPILDIKPYHHLESVDVFANGNKYANWIYNSCQSKKCEVIIKDEAVNNIEKILEDKDKKLIFYDKKEDLLELIKGVLEIDPHSKYTHKQEGNLLYGFHVDKLNVIYRYNAQTNKVIVEEVQYSEKYIKLRNKNWTEEYYKTHNFCQDEENENNEN